MNSESVWIPTSGGYRLRATIHGPVADAMVISCHGMMSNRESPKHRRLAENLAARGLGVVRFDFAGLGESEGALDEITYTRERSDLDAVIEYLVGRGTKRLGLFGSSMGGAVALLQAARDERVRAIATLAAVAHPAGIEDRHPHQCHAWRKRGYAEIDGRRIAVGFLDDAPAHDVLWAAGILRAPVLVIHGTEDDVVPVSDAHDIATSARTAELDIVEGADHRFTDPVHRRPAMDRAADFLFHHLEEAP